MRILIPASSDWPSMPDPVTVSPRTVTSGAAMVTTVPPPCASITEAVEPARVRGLSIITAPGKSPGARTRTSPGLAPAMAFARAPGPGTTDTSAAWTDSARSRPRIRAGSRTMASGVPRLDEHPRALGAPRTLGHVDRLRRRQRLRAQRAEREVRGHQLGERRRVASLVGVLRRDDLSRGDVVEQPRRGSHRRRRLRVRAAREETG